MIMESISRFHLSAARVLHLGISLVERIPIYLRQIILIIAYRIIFIIDCTSDR